MGRCKEIASLKWEYINGDTITIPTSEMKGRRDHRIWLCPDMIDLLKKIYYMTKDRKNEYVFNLIDSLCKIGYNFYIHYLNCNL